MFFLSPGVEAAVPRPNRPFPPMGVPGRPDDIPGRRSADFPISDFGMEVPRMTHTAATTPNACPSVSAESRWREIRARLAASVPPKSFETWFAATRARSFADGRLEIGVPSIFIKRALESQGGLALIERLAAEAFGSPVRVALMIDGELRRALQRDAAEVLADLPPSARADAPAPTSFASGGDAAPPPVGPAPAARPGHRRIEAEPAAEELPAPPEGCPHFRFDALVEAPENRLALAAARRAAEKPGEYPLLILHGRPGTGKTHLLHALCHDFTLRHPSARVVRASAREWTDEFVAACQDRRLEDFRRRHRECRLLAVDDFQALAAGNKIATQEEFVALLDALLSRAGRQVVIACDRPPHEWPRLSEKLRSRLGGGLVAGVDAPAGAERVALTRRKAEERGLALAPEVARVLAEGADDVRALEGAIARLAAMARLGGVPPTIAGARLALRGDGRAADRRLFSPEDVAKAVAEEFGVRLSDLRERKRLRTLCLARAAAAGLARGLTGESLAELGNYFGRRGHATMLSLIRNAAKTTAGHRQRLERVLARLGTERRLDELLPMQGGLFPENVPPSPEEANAAPAG